MEWSTYLWRTGGGGGEQTTTAELVFPPGVTSSLFLVCTSVKPLFRQIKVWDDLRLLGFPSSLGAQGEHGEQVEVDLKLCCPYKTRSKGLICAAHLPLVEEGGGYAPVLLGLVWLSAGLCKIYWTDLMEGWKDETRAKKESITLWWGSGQIGGSRTFNNGTFVLFSHWSW